ncbi:hypothetical protein [Cerasicoccus frondis]|uniref:hypothetical protein n=1 Tax=Cerasicoccus frondis TaxID=490090 RepID=UPI002852D70F|nr:hypothetical protein [Cerasicoccus frondis]
MTFSTFGAPFNAVDDDTRIALGQFPELNVWLYGSGKSVQGAKSLKRDYKVNLEPKVGHVDFEVFKKSYESNPPKSPLVLQGHPGMWDESEFAEFIKIVSYLREQGATFALPRDFSPEA